MLKTKKTKIIATISNTRCDVEFIRKLYMAGMDMVRINTAHQKPEETLKVVENVRAVSDKIAILIDTKGPDIRTRLTSETPIPVEEEETVLMTGDKEVVSDKKIIYVSYPHFVRDVNIGDRVLIDDGEVEFLVKNKSVDYIEMIALTAGLIRDKKSINVPGVEIDLKAITDNDREFIRFAVEHELDFIAHSFVRNKEDVYAIQQILDESNSDIKIIAKIENQAGIDNLDEILDNVYGILIARGDLGIEVDAEKIPRIQRHIVKRCRESKKPVIIATHMLHSMIENLHPTRAEVSDIANAVYIGSDALLLTGETAFGKYPVEAVQIMTKVVETNEGYFPPETGEIADYINNEITAALARAALNTTRILPIKAIVIDTYSGRTARYLSAYRGILPVYTRCYSKKVMRELALSYGIIPFYMGIPKNHDEFIMDIPKILESDGFNKDDLVLVIGGSFGYIRGASFMEICSIEEIKYRGKSN